MDNDNAGTSGMKHSEFFFFSPLNLFFPLYSYSTQILGIMLA